MVRQPFKDLHREQRVQTHEIMEDIVHPKKKKKEGNKRTRKKGKEWEGEKQGKKKERDKRKKENLDHSQHINQHSMKIFIKKKCSIELFLVSQ